MKLIALTGLPRSGKDTMADRMCNRYGFVRRAFATPLKQAAAILLNREVWEMEGQRGFDREALLPEWGFTTRRFLQWLGTEGLRSFDKDFWIKRMHNELQGLNKVVITDCRFPNEVELVHSLGGEVISIYRPGVEHNDHISNRPMPYDFQLRNEGTLEQFEGTIDWYADQRGWKK